jgi:probable DNA repair protein
MVASNSPDTPLILTPTARLARAERHRRAVSAVATGLSSWRTPRVLAFGNWMSSLIEQGFVTGAIEQVPISAVQAHVLWRSVINHQVFIGEPRVAEMAQASWRLIHEFKLPAVERWSESGLSMDQMHFKGWAKAYQALCKRRSMSDEWPLAARLPALIDQRRISLPKRIELAGFELPMPPLQREILDAAAANGVDIEAPRGPTETDLLAEIHSFTDTASELRAAAAWARARVESDPDSRLAVVVPDLREQLADAERAFRRTFDPAASALEAPSTPAWHCSLGPPLSSWPLVADALSCLQLDPKRLDQAQAELCWQSPFLAGAEQEAMARAQARDLLWRNQPWLTNAAQLSKYAARAGATSLSRNLRDWSVLRNAQRGPAPWSQWVERFQSELGKLGFGRGRKLDSREFQTLQRFHDLLEEFSTLELVEDGPIPRNEAVRRLREMAGDIKFRERNFGAPVEILGVEEALGSRFDAAWIIGLDDKSWPGVSRRDPFIPHWMQQKMPSADAQASLERSRDELRALAWIAPERVGSFSRGMEDVPQQPTPLLGVLTAVLHDDSEPRVGAPIEEVEEPGNGPDLSAGEIPGGTRVLQDQADCPFRAFARHRLGAQTPMPPLPGLDALTRGTLVHQVLERFWTGLPDQAALREMPKSARESRISDCIQTSLDELESHKPLLLSAAERKLEALCLQRILERWIQIELNRAPFAVIALEQPVQLQFAGLRLTGKIDRIDSAADDGEIIIDYKTGRAGSAGWFPEPRAKELQLPAYVSPRYPAPAGLAFARVRADDLVFDGVARSELGVPGIKRLEQSRFKKFEDWEQLLADWHWMLEQLAADFEAGKAAVDPRDNNACKRCDLEALCRINERGRRVQVGGDD